MRSPSLDLDSLYGAAPGSIPSCTRFRPRALRRRSSSSWVPTRRRARRAEQHWLLRGAWSTQTNFDVPRMPGTQHGHHRRPAQRREPDRRAVPSRHAAFPQRRRRPAARGGVRWRHLRRSEADRDSSLPVGGGERLISSVSAAHRRWTMRWPPSRRRSGARSACQWSSRWPPTDSGTA